MPMIMVMFGFFLMALAIVAVCSTLMDSSMDMGPMLLICLVCIALFALGASVVWGETMDKLLVYISIALD